MQLLTYVNFAGCCAEAERVYAALADGGQVFMPLQETFFASRFGQLRDRLGINWMVLRERSPQPADETQTAQIRAADAQMVRNGPRMRR